MDYIKKLPISIFVIVTVVGSFVISFLNQHGNSFWWHNVAHAWIALFTWLSGSIAFIKICNWIDAQTKGNKK